MNGQKNSTPLCHSLGDSFTHAFRMTERMNKSRRNKHVGFPSCCIHGMPYSGALKDRKVNWSVRKLTDSHPQSPTLKFLCHIILSLNLGTLSEETAQPTVYHHLSQVSVHMQLSGLIKQVKSYGSVSCLINMEPSELLRLQPSEPIASESARYPEDFANLKRQGASRWLLVINSF